MTAPSSVYMTEADRRSADTMNPHRATVRAIAKEVCAWTGHGVTEVMGNSRLPNVCRARELVCYIAYRHGLSLPEIGKALRRDHTTIMHAIQNEKKRRGEA